MWSGVLTDLHGMCLTRHTLTCSTHAVSSRADIIHEHQSVAAAQRQCRERYEQLVLSVQVVATPAPHDAITPQIGLVRGRPQAVVGSCSERAVLQVGACKPEDWRVSTLRGSCLLRAVVMEAPPSMRCYDMEWARDFDLAWCSPDGQKRERHCRCERSHGFSWRATAGAARGTRTDSSGCAHARCARVPFATVCAGCALCACQRIRVAGGWESSVGAEQGAVR